MVEERNISVIAHEVLDDWNNVHFTARPYLEAMFTMNSMDSNYGADSGASVVAYFLSNASSWRGKKARRIKAELRGMLKRRKLL